MSGIVEQAPEAGLDPSPLLVILENVLEPVQGLDNSHGRPVRPIEAARCGRLEVDFLLAQLDRFQAGVDQHFDPCRNGVCQPQVVRGSHPVQDEPGLVTPGDRANNGPIIRHSRTVREPVGRRSIVESAIDAAELAGSGKALQGLIDGSPGAKIDEVAGCPNLTGPLPGAVKNTAAKVQAGQGEGSGHVRNTQHSSDNYQSNDLM